jgi:hypothetical protein
MGVIDRFITVVNPSIFGYTRIYSIALRKSKLSTELLQRISLVGINRQLLRISIIQANRYYRLWNLVSFVIKCKIEFIGPASLTSKTSRGLHLSLN